MIPLQPPFVDRTVPMWSAGKDTPNLESDKTRILITDICFWISIWALSERTTASTAVPLCTIPTLDNIRTQRVHPCNIGFLQHMQAINATVRRTISAIPLKIANFAGTTLPAFFACVLTLSSPVEFFWNPKNTTFSGIMESCQRADGAVLVPIRSYSRLLYHVCDWRAHNIAH